MEWLEAYKKRSSEPRQDKACTPSVTPSEAVLYGTSSASANDVDEDYNEVEPGILDFDAGYEVGYHDGRWRSPRFTRGLMKMGMLKSFVKLLLKNPTTRMVKSMTDNQNSFFCVLKSVILPIFSPKYY